jgi:hypothetical protein
VKKIFCCGDEDVERRTALKWVLKKQGATRALSSFGWGYGPVTDLGNRKLSAISGLEFRNKRQISTSAG